MASAAPAYAASPAGGTLIWQGEKLPEVVVNGSKVVFHYRVKNQKKSPGSAEITVYFKLGSSLDTMKTIGSSYFSLAPNDVTGAQTYASNKTPAGNYYWQVVAEANGFTTLAESGQVVVQ